MSWKGRDRTILRCDFGFKLDGTTKSGQPMYSDSWSQIEAKSWPIESKNVNRHDTEHQPIDTEVCT
jgi:hypothetical protein